MGLGASSISIQIAQALPAEAAGPQNGGVLLPMLPNVPVLPTINPREWRLVFPFTQGYAAVIRRIHLSLPVFLGEVELEKQIATTKAFTRYKIEKEAAEASEGAGGYAKSSEEIQAIGFATPYQRIWQTSGMSFVPNLEAEHTSEVHTERSILPITVTVVTRISGPEGVMWSSNSDVPLHYVAGIAGAAYGVGFIDDYADLQNGLAIDPTKAYGMELLMFVPTAAKSQPRIGVEVINGTPVVGSQGEVTLFYDLETVPVGK